VLKVDEGRLLVGSVKRNTRTLRSSKPARWVLPLDLLGREGEGARAVALMDSGLVKLVEAAPGLTPYGMRHGYAWRGHNGYERTIPIRDLSTMMGHDPATHHRHYGKWTDEAGLEEAVARAMGGGKKVS
jgi:integrase